MAVNRSKYSPTAIINTPPEQRRHLLARLWLPAVLLLALAAGGLTGIIAAYELNYSRAANEVAALATYRPSVVTRVYADDDETVIGEFALEIRITFRDQRRLDGARFFRRQRELLELVHFWRMTVSDSDHSVDQV